jgi:CheY-like chemotaxis protein
MPEEQELLLIVDDEPDLCWALKYILQKHGYSIAWALSGQEALALMQTHRFSLVFLDAKLPDLDGLEVARRLQALNPAIQIVMVSGYFYRDDVGIQEALSQGLIRSFISKPFLQEEILNAIRNSGTQV